MRTRPAALLALTALLALGCAHLPPERPLERWDPEAGYRHRLLAPAAGGNSDSLFVILALSGGGTRAAALSYGLLEQLARTEIYWEGEVRTLLSEVDVISAVSGGSFTAAYYGLHGEGIFDNFERRFLKRRLQRRLYRGLVNPLNWLRLLRPRFDRIHLAAGVYHRELFDRATYGDLIAGGTRPFVILNATDVTLGARFEFTQDQFDLLCSDLAALPVATAVAASSAFPGLLSPLTLRSFRRGNPCAYRQPSWLSTALGERERDIRRWAEAERLAAFLDDAKAYVHLIDGGVSDNIGLRGPIEALISNDSPWSLVDAMNQKAVEKVVVITANARTGGASRADRKRNAPRLLGVFKAASTTPMARYSFESVALVDAEAAQRRVEQQSLEDCRAVFEEECRDGTFPAEPLQAVDFYAVEVAFDGLPAAHRPFFTGLPTSFQLPPSVVDCLRGAAGTLLAEARDFDRLLDDLDARARADGRRPPPRAPAPGYPWPCGRGER